MTVRRIILVIVGAVAAFMLFGFGLTLTGHVAPTDAPPPHVISGTFTLVDDATAANDCVDPGDGNWAERPRRRHRAGALRQLLHTVRQPRRRQAVTRGQFGDRACAYAFTVGVPDAEADKIDYPGGLTPEHTFEELQSADGHVSPDRCRFMPANQAAARAATRRLAVDAGAPWAGSTVRSRDG